MAKSLDHVLQPDGTYKWEEVELKNEADETSVVCPAPDKGILTANLKTMTKSELEIYGRSIGIELDKGHTKVDLIAELEQFISAK